VEGAVQAAELALELKPGSDLALYNLCKAKGLQYERTGDREALDKYVGLALEMAHKKPSPRNLGLLGIALVCKFHATGAVEALDEAIEASLKSIHSGVGKSSDLSKRLITLGNTLPPRTQWKGTREDMLRDISDSIHHLQRASRIMERKGDNQSASRTVKPVGYDANLAYALMTRYDIL